MKNEPVDQIKLIICEQLKLDANQTIDWTKNLTDLGLDSLDLIELVIKLEDAFKQEISDEQAYKFIKLADITNLLIAKNL